MKRVVLTGAAGFIGSYIAQDLLAHGYSVLGIDNYSKYGEVVRPQDKHPNYKLEVLDIAHDYDALQKCVYEFAPHIIIANAAKIGGISYFHEFAYRLLADNDRILANTFDVAVNEFMNNKLERIVLMSSSMVYENSTKFPSVEDDARNIPPPFSTYGQSKLHAEYYCQGANEQYRLPYTIVRPFNCVGVGEDKSISEHEITSGNIKLTLSHVLVDLCIKIAHGQYPVHILGNGKQTRCLTHGKDIARGIRMILGTMVSLNQVFNISTAEQITILDLAKKIFHFAYPDRIFDYVSDPPFKYDVQFRLPSVEKAHKLLGFTAEYTLDQTITEVYSYIKDNLDKY